MGRRVDNKKVVVRIDPKYFRPSEVETLLGDPTKAYKDLGWEPKASLEDLIKEMIDNDTNEAKKESYLIQSGFEIHDSKEV